MLIAPVLLRVRVLVKSFDVLLAVIDDPVKLTVDPVTCPPKLCAPDVVKLPVPNAVTEPELEVKLATVSVKLLKLNVPAVTDTAVESDSLLLAPKVRVPLDTVVAPV
jgi:hypothetical protein